MEIPSLRAQEIRDVADGSGQALISAVCAHLLATSGKQLRSSLLLAAASLGQGADYALARRAAAVTEALHLASLAHDDVIDDSDLRRGTVTVAAHFGCVPAALGGGWMFARCVEAMAACGETAVGLLAATVAELCDGEMLELEDLYNVNRTQARYMAAVRGKTAALFALAARVGGELAGLPEAACAALAAFGTQLGIAFQIADDVLDIVSEDLAAGKRRGSDVRHGVYTLPVLYALEEHPRLRSRLARQMQPADLPELLAAITATTGIKRALQTCRSHADEAARALSLLPESTGRHALRLLAERAVAPAWRHL